MIQVYEHKSLCCGCSACIAVCPQNAIEMENDENGFFYPVISQTKCVDCGLCKKICSFAKPLNGKIFQKALVAKHKQMEVVLDSRSGGFFTAISDIILTNSGTVYGAILDKDFVVRHSRATSKEARDAFRKSKYVQSIPGDIFSVVENDLKRGVEVLFTGTPCQCDGLKQYISKTPSLLEKLIICDLVCHSNASPGLFQDYLKYQSEKHNSKIVNYFFRDKDNHKWIEHVEKIEFQNGNFFYTDEYTNLFFTDDIRSSCFNCKYTSLSRASDITIADCWGGQKRYPEIVNDSGASLVLINSEKGGQYFNLAAKDMIVRNIDIEEVMQPRLKEPISMSETYVQFWRDYTFMNFIDFMKKYGHNNYSMKNMTIKKMKWIISIPYKSIKKICRIIRKD